MKHNGNVSVVENKMETENGSEQRPRQTPPKQHGSDVTISVVNKQGDNGTDMVKDLERNVEVGGASTESVVKLGKSRMPMSRS